MIPVVNNNNYVNNPWFIMFPKFHHSAALVPMIFPLNPRLTELEGFEQKFPLGF